MGGSDATVPSDGPRRVPLEIEGDVTAPAAAWRHQRRRLRAWLDDLPDDDWDRPTRCDEWDVADLVRHLVSGVGFLGHTLHQATTGEVTRVLEGFDPRVTPDAAAGELGELAPADARRMLHELDRRATAEMDVHDRDGWRATAEAPPGPVAAHVAVSHMVFDSWVHEHDLLLPGDERPPLVEREAMVAVPYALGLSSLVARRDAVALDVRLTDLDRRVGVEVADGRVRVTTTSVPSDGAVLEGRCADVVDLVTGRDAEGVDGDARALAALEPFVRLMAG